MNYASTDFVNMGYELLPFFVPSSPHLFLLSHFLPSSPAVPPPLPQAASSGRMADLLGGESATGFIGFEAVSRGMGGEEGEGAGGVDEVSHGAGAELQVVMKQLGKRDTTTKLKVCRV